MSVQITFLGAAGTVTGSRYCVEHEGRRLLVDCGLFQGYKALRLRNWAPLPVAPDQIDAVILTHAHLDHSGYLPVLVREGFRGRAWCTPGTRDLCALLLTDSGHLQEEDAAYANRHGFSKHHPALPLYTVADARRSLEQLHSVPFFQAFEPIPGWRAHLRGAGHILGASSLLLEVGGKRLLFSGDLGRNDDLIMWPPDPAPAADLVLIESTYGNREHPPGAMMDEMAEPLSRVIARGGVAVVPTFAIGRAQALLYAIAQLKAQGRLPNALPVYLDSPMGIAGTELLARYTDTHRLDSHDCRQLLHGATMTRTPEESKAIARQNGPRIILSASGMATGGRILHHLAHYLGDHRNLVLLTGHQAPGTRGDRLSRGETSLRIHGQDWAVRAEVVELHTASAHADAGQLMRWLGSIPGTVQQVCVVHGDPEASDALRLRIQREHPWPVCVPEQGDQLRL